MGGDTPHVINGVATDYKRLFYSDPKDALSVPIQCQAGYGTLPQGIAMAKNLSAAGNVGKFVPYNLTTYDGTEANTGGRVYVVSSIASGAVIADVTLEDSYKFAVGDDIIVNETGQTVQSCGAITDIDRSTYSHMARITFTTACTNGAATGNDACVSVEAGVSANAYSDCVGILGKAVDTGSGVNAKGGIGVLIISNAILYTGMLVNFDAAAIVDMSSTTFGNYTVLK